MTATGFKAATTDEAAIRQWWTDRPDANVALATGASGLTVVDIDHGLDGPEDLAAFCGARGLPMPYTVRTGRRDGYGVQLYFEGEGIKSIAWADEGVSGDIRGATGYVMAAGSVHPSGETYNVELDGPIAGVPNYVRSLRPVPVTGATGAANAPVADDGTSPISDHRNVHMIHLLGKKRAEGADDNELRTFALDVNVARFDPPLGEDELERLIDNACKFAMPEDAPEVLIGGKVISDAPQEPVDWRTRYHTMDEAKHVPPPSFLIDGFLMVDSITAIAAPVAQRKSLISLNVAHALCTGEPLFGHFKVTKRPTRVLYLCPEMGLASFAGRVRDIGLLPYVGKTFFFMTMNSEMVELDALTEDELQGAVVIIDTAVRYLKGDENSSQDMRAFAHSVFRLKRAGGGEGAVVLLHHSSKGTKESFDLTLENAMRGSGELGAFVTSCWATRLQDPDDVYRTPSYVTNVKQRDFESKPFEIAGSADYRMHYVDRAEGERAVLQTRQRGNKADKDGLDVAALAIIASHPNLSGVALSALMAEKGIKRSADWANKRKREKNYTIMQQTGVMP